MSGAFYRGRPPGNDEVAGPGVVEFVAEDGTVIRLPHVIVHSPSGFQWGYGGSGPADLALSLLCHAAGLVPVGGDSAMRERYGEAYDRVWARHQHFKREVIASLPMGEPWTMPAAEVLDAAS